jgi:sterol desaturase/sphingolipid hydroxylase (fatty acid hydroxylase superfamily)
MLGWEEIWLSLIEAFDRGLYIFAYRIQHPSFKNPFVVLVTVCALCFILESVLPKKLDYPVLGRRGFKLDLGYVFFMDFVLAPIGFYAVLVVMEKTFLAALSTAGFSGPDLFSVASLPGAIQVVVLFVLIDFSAWIGHYWLHRFEFLWQFHKIHHAQKTLGFASNRHFHWMEYLVFKPVGYIPLSMIGFSVESFFFVTMWMGYFLGFLSHSNVKIRWGFLNHLFITPDTHFWHHAKNVPHRYGVNFASVLVIWDQIFGVFYLPKNEQPELGIHHSDVPDGFIGQQLYPFKAALRPSHEPSFYTESTVSIAGRKNRRAKRGNSN